jgi:hypothetical protein
MCRKACHTSPYPVVLSDRKIAMPAVPHTVTVDQIAQIATDYYVAFPDMRECAREWARAMLKNTSKPGLDPDKVFWHRFDNAQNSALSFTGWQHTGPAESSLSLTELVIRRFELQDQIDFDLLDQMSGFYTVQRASRYDHTNEVPLAPGKVLQALWSIDVKSLYKQRLDRFWEQQGSNGRVLLKAMFFPRLWGAYLNNSVTIDQVKLIINTCCGYTGFPPTLQDIRNESVQRTYARVHTFTLGSATAADILRIRRPDGRQLLYIPSGLFKAFETERELYDWVASVARDKAARAELLPHFMNTFDSQDVLESEANRVLDTIGNTPWQPRQRLLNGVSRLITEDVFTYQYTQLKQRTERDAMMLLVSNYELRKQLFLVDLDSLARIAAGLAPGDPLLALISAGATSFSLGAHLAKAVHGSTPQERSQSFRVAVLQGLALMFDLPLLGASGKRTMAEFADLQEGTSLQSLTAPNEVLTGLSADLDVSVFPEGTGIRRGVHIVDDEHLYIRMQGDVFQVRYVESLQRWYVIDPDNPERLFGAWPVTRNWRGEWESYTEPARPSVIQTITSSPVLPKPVVPTPHTNLAMELDSFDTSSEYEELVRSLIGPDARRYFKSAPQGVFQLAREQLLATRLRLSKLSTSMLNHSLRTPPAVPVVDASMSPARFFETVYSDAYGLVIGEGMDAIGSKKLLIKYLAQLREYGVDTLYLEGFAKDLDQPLLDMFERTGTMPRTLEKRLRMMSMSSVQPEMARYNHFRLITEARRQGLKLKALDCAASLSSEGLADSDAALAYRMRLYYAHKRIASHMESAPQSKWIVLMDQERAANRGSLSGLATLTDVVHLRVVDINRTLPTRFSIDTGVVIPGTVGRIKGHVRLDMATLHSSQELYGSP